MAFNISIYNVDKLGRHAEIQSGFAFKSERFSDNPSDVALVKGENVQQGFVDWDASKYWPIGDADSLGDFELRVGDVVLAMDRPWVTAGLKWAYIKKDDPRALLVQRVARLRAKKGLDQTYLRCLVSSNYFSSYLQPIVTGVNVPHISGKQIGNFRIPLPLFSIQQKIAAILAAYDELIDNNQKRIALLEKMAEEIYREWFIRLRYPGHEQERIHKGIPKGWDVVRISDGIKFDKGISYSGEYLSAPGEGLPMVNLKCITVDSLFRKDGVKHYKGEYRKQHVVKKGDIVLANTDLTQSGGIIGNPVLVPKIGTETEMIISHHLCAVRLGVYKKYRYYFYHLFRSQSFKGHALGYANGATVLGLRTEDIERFQFVKPDDELIERFCEIAAQHYKKAEILAEANEVLQQARDALLPRLISGKLSVEHLDIQFPPSMMEETEAAHA